jgi:hypothetical protein
VEDFSLMRAQPQGVIVLPVELDWTMQNSYDISNALDERRYYETVLTNANKEQDIISRLNGIRLRELWPDLQLPRRVRYAWESVYPRLGFLRRGQDV